MRSQSFVCQILNSVKNYYNCDGYLQEHDATR